MTTLGIIGFSMLLLAAGQPVETAPNARVVSLEEAVELALVNNLNLLSTMDQVSGAQVSEGLAKSQFGFKVTPSFAGGVGSQVSSDQRYGLDVSKLLPFGATVSANVRSDVAHGDRSADAGSK